MTPASADEAFYREAPSVLHVILGQEQGGLETFFVKLAVALEQRGVRQKAVIQKGRPWAADTRAGGVAVSEIAFGGLLGDFFARRELVREIESFGPGVVLAWMGRAARRIPRGPYATAVRLPGFIGTRGLSRIDHAIVTTPIIGDFVASTGFLADRIHVIPNFGDMPAGVPMPRAEYDTPEHAPVLLSLGRFVEKKGFDVLIEALAKLPTAHLWLGGIGDLEGALKAQAAALNLTDRVHFLGWVTDQERLFAAADICVVPSRSEPFGNVVVEAWQSGCPLVATRSEGPGLIVSDGQDGLLVPIGDAGALAAAINRIIQEPGLGAMLAENGRRTHRERYSEEAICRSYVGLFSELARARQG